MGPLPDGWKEVDAWGDAQRRFQYEQDGLPFAKISMKSTEAPGATLADVEASMSGSTQGITVDMLSFAEQPSLGLDTCAVTRTRITMPEGYARPSTEDPRLELPGSLLQTGWICLEDDMMHGVLLEVQEPLAAQFAADAKSIVRSTTLELHDAP